MTLFPIEDFKKKETPFYFYDLDLLNQTLETLVASLYPHFNIHYAVKANTNQTILKEVLKFNFGADVVSGGEIKAVLEAGFNPQKIVFAGVGKADWEIKYALDNNIGCFNVESLPELEIIQEIAATSGKVANIAFRVNPNIDAHTHKFITTGLKENKFGINLELLNDFIDKALQMPNIKLIGLHFHIGSQITSNEPFIVLCERVNNIINNLSNRGINISSINLGGGLGIDYEQPDQNPIPDFKSFFDTIHNHIQIKDGQEIHFELGRSIVAQCGSLISRVLYIKHGVEKKYAILDAGFTELIRPALYQAHHVIQNLTGEGAIDKYDIVGPICESTDTFGEDEEITTLKRGDIVAIRSAGAYGEIMSMNYNSRHLNESLYKKR
jgi:diaminopimelate decarboxylase